MTSEFFDNKKRITVRIITSLLTIALLTGMCSVKASAMGPTKIDAMTFRDNTDITTVHIGSDVTEITPGAFKCLMKLRSITVSENNPFYTSYSNCLYNKDMTELLCFPPALDGAMIPSSVTSIGEYALTGVGSKLKADIRAAIKSSADNNLKLEDVPGEHFIHTQYGIKWREADGNYSEPDTELKQLVASVLDFATDENMTQNAQLERCFKYMVDFSAYERDNEVPVGNWTGEYAKEMLLEGKGNCYKYAAAFAYLAKGLGYDAKVCTGTVLSSLGGKTPHAWTEVKVNETWYIFDTEMQDAKGDGYYKQTYQSYPAKPLDKAAAITVSY
ncbi:hypothetical protein D6853_06405 [Butyrivibrio sp. X503]|uniref:transglutaminase domain-containing protein n=1 Tax=Butyrivibrio sp. X503 TaxID=2364878 RepID=UPI000EA8F6F7|nr:transglutaminase domain-containing protein [Butyrivibrio sp. X503]RKM56414.1 hypothetical protein D6853_06405 [Butyrivibrio sp. X503]